MRATTGAPPPEKNPNATPGLRTLTRSIPKKTESRAPGAMAWVTIALLAWSRATTPASTATARRQAAPAESPRMRRTMIPPTSWSTISPTIGLMSRGPIIGRKRRKIRR